MESLAPRCLARASSHAEGAGSREAIPEPGGFAATATGGRGTHDRDPRCPPRRDRSRQGSRPAGAPQSEACGLLRSAEVPLPPSQIAAVWTAAVPLPFRPSSPTNPSPVSGVARRPAPHHGQCDWPPPQGGRGTSALRRPAHPSFPKWAQQFGNEMNDCPRVASPASASHREGSGPGEAVPEPGGFPAPAAGGRGRHDRDPRCPPR